MWINLKHILQLINAISSRFVLLKNTYGEILSTKSPDVPESTLFQHQQKKKHLK